MRLTVGATLALSFTLLTSAPARAQSWPSPADLSRWLSNPTVAPVPVPPVPTTCPTVEVAPNVRVPICAGNLPKPPPGVIVPEAVFGPLLLAPSVDLRARGLDGPVKDQKQTGVCYAFAITSVLETSLRAQGGRDVLSPLHVVAAGTWNDLFTSASGEAIAPEASWPYDPIKACRFETGSDECEHAYGVRTNSWRSDPVLVAERDRVRGAGAVTVGKASTITREPVAGIMNALSAGRAVYGILDIDSVAWDWRSARGGVLPEYAHGDRGAHAIAFVGYRLASGARQFLIHNSWGPGWGENGYVWISEAGLRRHFVSAYVFDATPGVAVARAPAPPTSTATTCAAGTAIDLGTGRCAAVCRSGLAPFMGQCWAG